jgi:predicted Zn-ribbon and HTH transcriptional regulator
MNARQLKCKRCGYEWVKRVEGAPKTCPKCKSHRWDLERKGAKNEASR